MEFYRYNQNWAGLRLVSDCLTRTGSCFLPMGCRWADMAPSRFDRVSSIRLGPSSQRSGWAGSPLIRTGRPSSIRVGRLPLRPDRPTSGSRMGRVELHVAIGPRRVPGPGFAELASPRIDRYLGWRAASTEAYRCPGSFLQRLVFYADMPETVDH